MMKNLIKTIFTFALFPLTLPHPYYEPIFNYDLNPFRSYSPYYPTYTNDLLTSSYLTTPDYLPVLNILAEVPHVISKTFTVVPMYLMSKDNMKTVTDVDIMSVSKEKPEMIVRTGQNERVKCTPAVRVVLDKPFVAFSLKSEVLFPTEIEIVHRGYKIPIKIGAVIAPIRQDTFVSVETPIAIRVVYAVPTKPVTIDYINNRDAIFVPETEAVVVESEDLPPKNVTVLNFPETEAEPTLQVNEEDEELVNRRPPQFLAPGGIIASDQPQIEIRPFVNSKESPALIAMREEAKKRI